jgi:hypothetical protein
MKKVKIILTGLVFNNALNPRPRRERTAVEEEQKEETPAVVQEPVVEKAPEEAPKQEETEEKVEENKEGTFEKRKKKGALVEEKKEDLLERPENAISLAEYKEKLRVKNQAISNETKNVTRAENSDLKPQTRNEDLSIGLTDSSIKTKNKPKDKKQDAAKELTVEFKTEEIGSDKYRDRNQRGQGKNKNQGKFQFSKDDFPEF